MGYTHYWTLHALDAATRAEVVTQLSRIAAHVCEQPEGPPIEYEIESTLDGQRLHLNGTAPDDYESFVFPRTGKRFCKTAENPYDVVVACLAAAQDILGDHLEVHGDGDAEDWVKGVALASEVLRRDIAVPAGVVNRG